MQNKNQISDENRKSLQDFVVGYYFVFRIQLENAELLAEALSMEVPKNSLLSELGHGYIIGAVTEFVLLLYDTVQLLKKVTTAYEYKKDGAIDLVFKFRRNILVHRGCNWGSHESKKMLEFLQQNQIYESFHKAALEFVEDLQKFISFEPIEKYPTIQKIWKKELVDLFRNSPELKFNYTVPNIDEVIRFFGVTLMPNKPQ